MIVELNIGLHRDGEPNDAASVSRRAAYSYRVLCEVLVMRGLRSYVLPGVSYVGPDGAAVTEPTLAARCAVDASREVVLQLVDMVADRLGQACIAARIDGEGYMIGPAADQWGDFDEDYFVASPWEAPALNREAA